MFLPPLIAVAAACQQPPSCDEIGLTAQPSAHMPTVLTATWSGAGTAVSWSVDGTTHTAVAQDQEPRSVAIVGPGAQASVWLGVDAGGGVVCEAVAVTGSLPGTPPVLTSATHGETDPAPWLVATVLSPEPAVLIAERTTGEVVWYLPLDGDTISNVAAPYGGGLGHDVIARDMAFSTSELRVAAADGTVTDVVELVRGHHGWTETPAGLVYLSNTIRQVWVDEEGADVPVVGDAVRRIDDSGDHVLFDLFDHLEVTPGTTWDREFYPGGFDWTHASGLWADDQHVLVSLRGHPGVLEIREGDLVRHLGAGGTHPVDLAEGELNAPHSPSLTPQGTVLLFTYDSRGDHAVELSIEADRAVETWQHGRLDGLHTGSNGLATRLDGGNTLVGWTGDGVVREVGPQGDIRWELHTDGATFSHVAVLHSLPW